MLMPWLHPRPDALEASLYPQRCCSSAADSAALVWLVAGAEVPASADAGGNVDLDPERFLKTLGEVLGIDPKELNGGGDDSSSEGSSFFSDDDDDDDGSDSDDERRDGGAQGFASPGVGGFRR